MTKRARWLIGLWLATGLAGPLLAAEQEPAMAASSAQSADARLKALYDAEWAWRAQEFGRDPEGDREGSDRMPRVDPASQARRAA